MIKNMSEGTNYIFNIFIERIILFNRHNSAKMTALRAYVEAAYLTEFQIDLSLAQFREIGYLKDKIRSKKGQRAFLC